MRKFDSRRAFAICGAAVFSSAVAIAQISMVTDGVNSQTFNTLATTGTANPWVDNSTIPSWFLQRTGTSTTYSANAGTSNTGTAYSYGTGTSLERAMGSIGASALSAGDFAYGVLLRNNSGQTIYNISVSYVGEQWRNSAAGAQTVSFFYRTSPTVITSLNPNNNTSWTAVTALNFTSPVTGGTAAALNGNAFGNRVVKTATTLPGLSLAPGAFIMLKWDDPNHAGSDHGLAVDDVIVTWSLPVPAYYSQSNGTVSDGIWATSPVGTPGPAFWSPGSSMVVQTGDTVTVNSVTNIKELTTEASSRLVVLNGVQLNVKGNSLSLAQFSISAASGTVELSSTAPVTLNSAGIVAFNNLTVNTPAGTTVNGGVNIFGTLLLTNGVFNATNASMRLRSDANRTGRLGPVAPAANYLGNLVMERYIPGGAINWRMLGAPVSGGTIADWNDDFFTAGFPGSDYPNFIVNGQPWPSIRKYDESNMGTGVNDGLIGVAGVSEAFVPGRGYTVWCGDNLGGTNPFLITVPGQPVIATSPFTLPMTYTNTGTPSVDGYNLVSNPLPSPISFAAISRGADVLNQYSSYNPINGNLSNWNGIVGTNGATNVIQSSQAFYLKANGPLVSTTVSESAKVASNAGGLFGGNERANLPLIRLVVSSEMNTYSDEVVVVFKDGTPTFGVSDVRKVLFGHPEAPKMAVRSADGEDLAIDMYGNFGADISIPVLVNAPVSGMYTVTAAALTNQMGLSCISLEDLITGVITPLSEGASYEFFIDSEADATMPRLMLRASAPVPFSTTNATCANTPNGQATVDGIQGPVDVSWTDAFGNVLLQQSGVNGSATFGGLAAGSYGVRLNSAALCGELTRGFTITAPFELEAVAEVVNTTCRNIADGGVDILVLGGVAPYTYLWSDSTTLEDLEAGAGNYFVSVTDANNCVWTSEAYMIEGNGPVAEFTASATMITVGDEVEFQSPTDAAEITWSFGDGTSAEGENAEHTYSQPGIYTVVLTATDGTCVDQATMDITVELSTGLTISVGAATLRAWATPAHIVVEHGLNSVGTLNIELLDATGRLHLQRQVGALSGRITLPAEDLSAGIWFVRVTNGETQSTVRVPVVR